MMLNKAFNTGGLKNSKNAFDASIYLYNFLFHFHSGLLLFYAPLWGSSVLKTSSTSQAYIYIFVLLASSVITKPLGATLLLFDRIRNNQALAFKVTACMQVASAACLALSLTLTTFGSILFLCAKFLQGAALGCENSMVRMIYTHNHDRYIQRMTTYEMMCVFSYMIASFYLYDADYVKIMLYVYWMVSILFCLYRFFVFKYHKFATDILKLKAINKAKAPVLRSQKILSFLYVAALQFLYQVTFFFPFVLCQMYQSFLKIQFLLPLQEKMAMILLFLWDALCLWIIAKYVDYKKMTILFYAGMLGLMLCVSGYGYIVSQTSYVYVFILQMITILTGLCVMVPQMQWGFEALKGYVSYRFLPFSQGAVVHISSGLLGRLLPIMAVMSLEKTSSLTEISLYSSITIGLILFLLSLCNRIFYKNKIY